MGSEGQKKCGINYKLLMEGNMQKNCMKISFLVMDFLNLGCN